MCVADYPEFGEWIREYSMEQFGNEFIFYDYDRNSMLTPHGEDMLAAYLMGREQENA